MADQGHSPARDGDRGVITATEMADTENVSLDTRVGEWNRTGRSQPPVVWPRWFRFLWLVTSPAVVVYLLYRASRDRTFRRSLPERLYLSRALPRKPRTETFLDPSTEPTEIESAPVFWLHAASLGEFQGARPLLKELRVRVPKARLIVTTTSNTGRDAARESGLADEVLFLPIDIPWVVRRAVRLIRPSIVVIAETELWPQLIYSLSARSIPIHVLNGRISDRTVERYQRFSGIFGPMLQSIAFIDVQTDLDRDRFLALGADPARVRVTGSTKYDQPAIALDPEEREIFLRDFCLPLDSIVLTLGSVRPGEEELVIDAAIAAQREHPRLALIVAPRHEQRFERVADLLRQREVPFFRRSLDRNSGPIGVLLLDTYGELVRSYSVSDLAFVGGTFISIGGHNPVEPALCGAAVIVGPEVGNIRDAVTTLRSEGGLFQVHSSEELTQQILLFCADEVLRYSARGNARRASERYTGLASRLAAEFAAVLQPGADANKLDASQRKQGSGA